MSQEKTQIVPFRLTKIATKEFALIEDNEQKNLETMFERGQIQFVNNPMDSIAAPCAKNGFEFWIVKNGLESIKNITKPKNRIQMDSIFY
jgi:hypothetical protein